MTSKVDEYLAKVPEEQRAALEKLRKTIKSVAPDTTEEISYEMPMFKYKGRPLVGIAAYKKHCSFFPCSGSVLDQFEKELGEHRTSKGTVQFSPDAPLATTLVKKVVKARMAEIDAKAKR